MSFDPFKYSGEQTYDVHAREAEFLDSALKAETEAALGPQVKVKDELARARILEAESSRIKSRVLFVTADQNYKDESYVKEKLEPFSSVFEEIHILLSTDTSVSKEAEVTRVAPKVWLYKVSSRFLFLRTRAARKLVARQLVFGEGFRPDVIVALDPYESGEIAKTLAEKYDRPWQLHIRRTQFIYELDDDVEDKKREWQLSFVSGVIEQAPSVRVATEQMKEQLQQHFALPEDTKVLPQFFNLAGLRARATTPTPSLFPQFKFIVGYAGNFHADNKFYQALDTARALLSTPTVGMVVYGTGPLLEKAKERANLLGLSERLFFTGERHTMEDVIDTVDILIVPETTKESNVVVIKAAVLQTPLLMAVNEFRQSLFEERVTALLFPEDEVSKATEELRAFMNNTTLRTQLKSNLAKRVLDRIEEDPEMYRIAYRNSIEDTLVEVSRERAEAAAEAAEAAAPQTATEIDGVAYKLPPRPHEDEATEQ